MRNVRFPYHKSYMYLSIDEDKIKNILHTKAQEYKTELGQEEIVLKALQDPIDSPRSRDLAKKTAKVLVITSDHTRPVPSKITLPLFLEEIRSKNRYVKIKILIATGFHRATTREEMIDKFGREIVDKEEIINHDSRDMKEMVFKGILPSGGELWLNSLLDWADITVSEGFIEPHFFAGFSGGRKSILPGIASEKTIFANHCSEFIADRNATTGNLKDNPVHEDMLFAAEKANLKFILNVVINSKKEIIGAFAGDHIEAHKKGCELVMELSNVKSEKADIVIVSNGGYPFDMNIYQAVKGMTAAEACVNKNGVIIMIAACNNGHGGEGFYRWMKDIASPEDIMKTISGIPRNETCPDQWEAQILARVLMKAKVILVTDMCDPDIIQNMKMMHSISIDEALKKAFDMMGENALINVITDGIGVIVNT